MQIVVARTSLQVDGIAVGREVLTAEEEPVVGLRGGFRVFESKDDELLLQGVLLADGLDRKSVV